jgi:hypothetical protein
VKGTRRALHPRSIGAVWCKAFAVMTFGVRCFIAVALVARVQDRPWALALLPVPALGIVIAGWIWQLGIFETSEALVIHGVVRNRCLPWDQVLRADVDSLQLGFRAERCVVLQMSGGRCYSLWQWNAHSALMLGTRDGVNGLAQRINAAIAQNHAA